MSANRLVASAVLIKVSSTKTVRRRLAARCQGSRTWEALFGKPPVLANGISAAVPRLFQNPRQGLGVIEPRLMGGAVTAFGWRSSRKVLRVETSGMVDGLVIGKVMV